MGRKWESYSTLEKTIIIGLPIGFLILAAILAVSFFSIFSSVKSICTEAQQEFGGDSVEALMSFVESDKFSYRKKNKAIWALGQIGDPRAIPLLEKLHTGEVQEPPYDSSRGIVQYTVKKALKQCRGEFSLTRWMYDWL
jgi:hypothetical protein